MLYQLYGQVHFDKSLTELAKKACLRLRDSASDRGGDFTHPRTNFFGHLCTSLATEHWVVSVAMAIIVNSPFLFLSTVSRLHRQDASAVMQRLSFRTETAITNKITGNRIVPSFKDCPQKPLRRRTQARQILEMLGESTRNYSKFRHTV